MKKGVLTTIVGDKTVINGESKLLLHIPGVKDPMQMKRMKYFTVEDDTIKFYGTGGKPYKISNLTDAKRTAEVIMKALKFGTAQLILKEQFFKPKSDAKDSGDNPVT